jgi:dolichol-phosphate mannosyltransferase
MTTITVVIPAYNEGAAFGSGLVSIADYFAIYRGAGYDFRYLIVDDGSRDETAAAASAFARFRSNVRVLTHPVNRGLGAALRTAFDAVESEFVLVLDADLSYTPALGMELIEALERQDADLTVASAYMRGGSVVNVPWTRRVLSREANRLLSLAASGRYATFTCMVRAYRTSALRRLTFTSDGMDANAEIMLCALRNKLRVVEIPATLRWSEERRTGGGRLRVSRLASQTWSTMRLAFAHRPALWLAVPGLFPGLLPIVVAILLILRVSPTVLAEGTVITVVIQYTSLAIFAGQLSAFFARTFRTRRRQTHGVTRNDYDLPKRTA